ncbi:hypothetical protein CSUI_009625 [Cystoisospora suis]|uniref:Uncharacterized protein n=1 Tax=Cystoisospora suis TaxID=483139 RepID=A0A2C6KJ98_9APIC|nr:hypothetical protein CSUI_009625 [Cystoisospora suis]
MKGGSGRREMGLSFWKETVSFFSLELFSSLSHAFLHCVSGVCLSSSCFPRHTLYRHFCRMSDR